VYKGFNRAIATASAGLIALGVNWVASKSGDKLEPFITSGSLFLLGMFFLMLSVGSSHVSFVQHVLTSPM
jgi:hypothetical protein